jgi:glycosyltransferase involved in cell wall biosynthesis
LEIKKIPGVELISVNRKGKYDFWVITRMLSLLRQKEVDVIQTLQTPSTFFGFLSAILCRIPVKIATERSSQRKMRLGYSLYVKVEDLLTRFADRVVSNSDAGKKYLIKRHFDPRRIRVVYNGLNINRLAPDKDGIERVRQKLGVSPEGKVVGILAYLTRSKDHATFLRAAAIINHVMPDTRFALVGDGPLRSDLENLAQELGIASNTVFFGEQKDIGTYLSAFDVAVLTSQAEGCSNSLLEAMALEKPVVANDVGGNRELVHHGETGLLVPFGNAAALADAVLSLIRDPHVAVSMGRRAREYIVDQFSLEKMIHQYQSLYDEALRQKVKRR